MITYPSNVYLNRTMRQYSKTSTSADQGRPKRKLDLLVSGFGQQDIVTTPEIIQMIDQLPRFHLEGLRSISYEPEQEPLRTLAPGLAGFTATRHAEFLQRQRTIIIYHFNSPELLWHLLYHEIGHYVFFLIISSKIKKHWVVNIYPHSQCITKYAGVSAQEDFAESYAIFARQPEALKAIPEKYEFMRQQVFSGHPSNRKERALDRSI